MAPDHRKIVCIEDDRDTAALIAEELSERFGGPIILAHDGPQGLAAILRERWRNCRLQPASRRRSKRPEAA